MGRDKKNFSAEFKQEALKILKKAIGILKD